MIFNNPLLPILDSDFFERNEEKFRIKQKELGEKAQAGLVHAIGQVSPEAAETVDQAINNACNLAESIGNVMRQQRKYAPRTETPTSPSPLDMIRQSPAYDERVTVSDCKLADHLFRDGGGLGAVVYSHHAIYVGGGHVLHYAHDPYGDICIHEAAFEEFAEGYPVYRLSGAESPLRYSAEEAVQRARSREWESQYNLAVNNCENFVRWCRFGKPN